MKGNYLGKVVKTPMLAAVMGYLVVGSAMAADAATDTQEDDMIAGVATCEETVPFKVQEYPGEANMGNTNNLRRITGLGFVAEGQAVTIRGRVVDPECLPITNARVQLWHRDSKGRYAQHYTKDSYDPYFIGSGVTYTNNMGEFVFLTVKPGQEPGGKAAPFVNVKVEHAKQGKINTRFYFPDEIAANKADKELQQVITKEHIYPIAEKTVDAKGDVTYIYNITLEKRKKFTW